MNAKEAKGREQPSKLQGPPCSQVSPACSGTGSTGTVKQLGSRYSNAFVALLFKILQRVRRIFGANLSFFDSFYSLNQVPRDCFRSSALALVVAVGRLGTFTVCLLTLTYYCL